MIFWRLMNYWPEPGINPIEDWYARQEREIRAEFDIALVILASNEDWANVPEFRPLKGKNAGLYEIVIDVRLPYERKQRHFRAIGIWQPDSRDFILLIVCEKTGKTYNPPLETALDYKNRWERERKGEIYGHSF
jgi:hypothetical protein